MEDMIRLLAAELGQKPQHVGAVVRLLDEGNTIPFIARYRKEQHGAMDDTTLRTLAERLQYLRNLAQRREEIRRSIAAQEKLTDELFSREIVGRLRSGYAFLLPYYDYFVTLDGDPDPRETP